MSNVCEFYPCHENLPQGFSCELCYCPEYFYTKCSGNPKWIKNRDSRTEIKDCSECTINHTSEYVTKHFKEKLENEQRKDAKDKN
jgi:Zn-finger protein